MEAVTSVQDLRDQRRIRAGDLLAAENRLPPPSGEALAARGLGRCLVLGALILERSLYLPTSGHRVQEEAATTSAVPLS